MVLPPAVAQIQAEWEIEDNIQYLKKRALLLAPSSCDDRSKPNEKKQIDKTVSNVAPARNGSATAGT
jgi:hypothetical protein